MENGTRSICYDPDLQIEAYCFEGIMQEFPNHFHDYYVLGLIEKGRRHLICNQKDYDIDSGDITLFKPGDNHTCRQLDQELHDYRCINIQPESMKKATMEITGKYQLPRFTQSVLYQSELADPLRELYSLIVNQEKDFKKEEVYLFLLEQLITEYSDDVPLALSEESSPAIKAVCCYLDANFSQSISLEQLSVLAGISKYHLLHSFTKQKGISPYSYLEAVRINQAKKLLEHGTPPVEAALQTGFHDQSHFTNFFKKIIGLTPKQYSLIFKTK